LQSTDDLSGVTLLTGRAPAPGECLLGAGVAEIRQVGVGDDLIVVNSNGVGVPFEIVGLFSAKPIF